jgi:hypothetical protein
MKLDLVDLVVCLKSKGEKLILSFLLSDTKEIRLTLAGNE